MAKHPGKGEGSKSQGEGKRGTTSSHRHVQQSAHSRDAEKAVSLVKRIQAIVEARNARARKKQHGG
jgi:hypothetical protein